MLGKGLVDNENEAYWIVQKWEAGGDSYSRYDAINAAVRSGASITAEMQELTSRGYTEEDVISHIKSSVRQWYQDGEITKQQATNMLTRYTDLSADEVTSTVNRWSSKVVTGIAFDDIKDSFMDGKMTQSRAVEMYVRYGGYTQQEAQDTVTEWKCEKDTGIPYEELSEQYVAGKITSSRAQELRVEYGGSSLEDARKTVLKWDCEKDHGIKYGELSTAYLSGEISKTDAINWQMKYGEKSREDAELAVQGWVWRADNPKYKDLSDQKIDRFITYCEPASIDIALYYKAQDYVRDIESDGTSGNVKRQYVDYILSLGLDSNRAKAMWNALKNSTWKDTGTPF